VWYSQVPGVDYTERFASLLSDVSFRIMLIVKLVWNMTSTVVDIETAFLHGNLDTEIYLDKEVTPTKNYLRSSTKRQKI
jgi:hypothetical protein